MTSPRRLYKARRRFHRAFFRWLHENQTRFLTAPFQIIKRTDSYLAFTIPGLNPVLSFGLSTWELGVHVTWQGTWWDALVFFESLPEKVSGGYICNLCDSNERKTYPSREALWINHDFEPFLEWVNTKLAQHHWLALNGEANSCTWAELINEPDPEALITVPIWLE